MDDGGVIIFSLVLRVIFGAISGAIASGKGRSTAGWFFGGFFLGLIGIIIVACLSNLKDDHARIQRDIDEKRRLREQLRQEQMKSESYRQYTTERLDAHDQHLGIDTKETQVMLPGASPSAGSPYLNLPNQTPPIAGAPPPMDISDGAVPEQEFEWYYSNNQADRSGPFTLGELQQLYAASEVNDQTLIWSEKLADWTAAAHVTELRQSAF